MDQFEFFKKIGGSFCYVKWDEGVTSTMTGEINIWFEIKPHVWILAVNVVVFKYVPRIKCAPYNYNILCILIKTFA